MGRLEESRQRQSITSTLDQLQIQNQKTFQVTVAGYDARTGSVVTENGLVGQSITNSDPSPGQTAIATVDKGAVTIKWRPV